MRRRSDVRAEGWTGAAVLLASLGMLVGGCNARADATPMTETNTERSTTSAPPTEESEMAQANENEGPVVNHTVLQMDGSEFSLESLRGQAFLIVNTASECGYTRQLGGLQELHTRYADRGFSVLGFPCNDFGGQEPGSNEEIATFCSGEFGVTFPLFDKVHAVGDEQHALYRTLTEETPEGIRGPVRWNFTKFLVGPDGRVLARFEPGVEPLSDELIAAVEGALPR